MKKINYKVQGFREDRRFRDKQSITAKGLTNNFEGCIFDEIELHANIKSTKELNDFIDFLIQSRPCLEGSHMKQEKL